jgi:hypothetical protein
LQTRLQEVLNNLDEAERRARDVVSPSQAAQSIEHARDQMLETQVSSRCEDEKKNFTRYHTVDLQVYSNNVETIYSLLQSFSHSLSTQHDAIAELTMLAHELSRKADSHTKVALEQTLTSTLGKWNVINADVDKQHKAICVRCFFGYTKC